jgi:hypothetical protein
LPGNKKRNQFCAPVDGGTISGLRMKLKSESFSLWLLAQPT